MSSTVPGASSSLAAQLPCGPFSGHEVAAALAHISEKFGADPDNTALRHGAQIALTANIETIANRTFVTFGDLHSLDKVTSGMVKAIARTLVVLGGGQQAQQAGLHARTVSTIGKPSSTGVRIGSPAGTFGAAPQPFQHPPPAMAGPYFSQAYHFWHGNMPYEPWNGHGFGGYAMWPYGPGMVPAPMAPRSTEKLPPSTPVRRGGHAPVPATEAGDHPGGGVADPQPVAHHGEVGDHPGGGVAAPQPVVHHGEVQADEVVPVVDLTKCDDELRDLSPSDLALKLLAQVSTSGEQGWDPRMHPVPAPPVGWMTRDFSNHLLNSIFTEVHPKPLTRGRFKFHRVAGNLKARGDIELGAFIAGQTRKRQHLRVTESGMLKASTITPNIPASLVAGMVGFWNGVWNHLDSSSGDETPRARLTAGRGKGEKRPLPGDASKPSPPARRRLLSAEEPGSLDNGSNTVRGGLACSCPCTCGASPAKQSTSWALNNFNITGGSVLVKIL
jgi:hypothetical protein